MKANVSPIGRGWPAPAAARRSRGGYGRRSRSRGGFVGPFPYYQRRTRGGSRVTVSGCCLPIPLGLVVVLGAGARLLAGR